MCIKRMHTHDAHGPPYFFSSSAVMQFRKACYTVVSYAPYILLRIYTITILATFGVTIFDFFHPGPQPSASLIHISLTKRPFYRTEHGQIVEAQISHRIAASDV